MIYEMRVYEPVEGRADAVRERFVNEVVPRLAGHGIDLVGVFRDPGDGRLIYISRFETIEAQKAAWASFAADQDWKAIKARSEASGPLIQKQTAALLEPLVPGLALS